jgi:TRAP-type C4-dicarboxylate transport system permease small subunit
MIDCLASLFGFGLFGLIIWQLLALGHSFQTAGEHSATVRIPYYPFAYSIALASIPVCLIYLQKFLNALRRIKG